MSIRGIRVFTVVMLLILVTGCGQSEPTARATSMLSTPTPMPPTGTSVPPTATQVVPTQTAVPPTASQVPPTNTATPLPTATQTLEPTATLAPLPGEISPSGGVLFVDSGQRLGNRRSWNVDLGDLDGDGDLDAFVANDRLSQVWLNDGQGVFSEGQQQPKTTSGLRLGDLDQDGDLDAFAVSIETSCSIWFNDGFGAFTTGSRMPMDTSGYAVALGDVDADDDLDAFIGRQGPNTLWLNDGRGEFIDSGQRFGQNMSIQIVLADLDSDGDLDAFEVEYGGSHRVWFNDGLGTFVDSGQILDVGPGNSHGVALGDVDDDGDLDAFVAIAERLAFQVWFNDGSGTFINSGQSLPSSNAQRVALGDLDSDGDLDAFMTHTGSSDAGAGNTVWLNDGHGTFFDSGLRLGHAYSLGIALGDLDGDGDLDAFVTNSNFARAVDMSNRVWLNETP